ncbi:hypothetical protein PAMA_002798 [Pampus argenteus]
MSLWKYIPARPLPSPLTSAGALLLSSRSTRSQSAHIQRRRESLLGDYRFLYGTKQGLFAASTSYDREGTAVAGMRKASVIHPPPFQSQPESRTMHGSFTCQGLKPAMPDMSHLGARSFPGGQSSSFMPTGAIL